ncbi:amidase [Streptomyces mirabilis]|uniref:hypothetical protein n=1 Tax=Streptomyces mirabilis TaxID=68239 RepID=UPI00364A91D8
MSDELWRCSAERTARRSREREVSPVDPLAASPARLEVPKDVTNAFGEIADDALAKLTTPVTGQPTPDGTAAYLEGAAADAAPALTRLLDAGAIPVGRTSCPPSAKWPPSCGSLR